jgi:hypothetical protein
MLRGMMYRLPCGGGLRTPAAQLLTQQHQHQHHMSYHQGLQSLHEIQLQQVALLLPFFFLLPVSIYRRSLLLTSSAQQYALQAAAANPIPSPIPISLAALTGVAQIPLVKVAAVSLMI